METVISLYDVDNSKIPEWIEKLNGKLQHVRLYGKEHQKVTFDEEGLNIRFAHVILDYIVTYYDELKENTLFLRSNPKNFTINKKIEDIEELINNKDFQNSQVLFIGGLQKHIIRDEEIDKFTCKHMQYPPVEYPYVEGYQFKASKNTIHMLSKQYYKEFLDLMIQEPDKYENIFEKTIMTLTFSYNMKGLPNKKDSVKERILSLKDSNIYVLRTHKITNNVRVMFKKLQDDYGPEKCFMIYDITNGPVPSDFASHFKIRHWDDIEGVTSGPCIITVKEDECTKLNSMHLKANPNSATSMHRAEAHIAAFMFCLRKKFDYMWFIEFDVYCHGSIKRALESSHKIHCDILTTQYKTPFFDPTYVWWNDLYGEMANTPIEIRRACFFPINRFSWSFLERVIDNLHTSSGFCEIYFTTLCTICNMTIKEIPAETFGIYRYRPFLDDKMFQNMKEDDKIYHPIKT